MTPLSKIVVFVILLLPLTIINGQEKNVKLVEIPNTQVLDIKSHITNKDYKIYLNFPRNIDDPNKTFPVIYLLDAQWDFPLLNAIYGEQYFDGFLPDAIVVGITWGGKNPNPDSLRVTDFTPTKTMQDPTGGGAQKFLSFIKEELIPFIDGKFKTKKDDRTLMGSSLGGLFTLYALFNDPSVFNNYVLTSPAIQWDKGVINSYMEKFSGNSSGLTKRLSMAIGGYEDVNSYQKFVDKLKEKNFPGLKIKSKVIDGVGHSGGKADGYTRGLQFAFEKEPIKVADKILEKYEGDYKSGNGMKVSVKKVGNSLIIGIPTLEEATLYPETEKDFYEIGRYALVHFKIDDNGNVSGFQLEAFANKLEFEKVQ